MPTYYLLTYYALSSTYIGNASRALLSTDWPAYGYNMGSLWYTLACVFLAAAETAAPAAAPPVIGGGSEQLTSSGQEPPERHAARRPAGVAGIWAVFFQMESVLIGRNRKDEQATKSSRSQCIDINQNST